MPRYYVQLDRHRVLFGTLREALDYASLVVEAHRDRCLPLGRCVVGRETAR